MAKNKLPEQVIPDNYLILIEPSIDMSSYKGSVTIKAKVEKSETIVLQNQKDVKGDIEVHIEFQGKIGDSLQGIYKSKYEHNGKTNYIITTQCESPYARQIFPCFDEPDKKATFDLMIMIEK